MHMSKFIKKVFRPLINQISMRHTRDIKTCSYATQKKFHEKSQAKVKSQRVQCNMRLAHVIHSHLNIWKTSF